MQRVHEAVWPPPSTGSLVHVGAVLLSLTHCYYRKKKKANSAAQGHCTRLHFPSVMFIIKLRKELKGEAHMIINATNSQINHTAVCHSHKELFDWVGRKDPSVPHWQTTQRKQTMGTEQRHYTEQGTHKSLKFSIVLKVFTTAIKSRQSCRLQMQFNSQVWRC